MNRSDFSARADAPPPSSGGPIEHALTPLDSLLHDAMMWRALNSSLHVTELLSEWYEWYQRRQARETSAAINEAANWLKVAKTPTYAELRRRRDVATTDPLTPEQIRTRAAASAADAASWADHPGAKWIMQRGRGR